MKGGANLLRNYAGGPKFLATGPAAGGLGFLFCLAQQRSKYFLKMRQMWRRQHQHSSSPINRPKKEERMFSSL